MQTSITDDRIDPIVAVTIGIVILDEALSLSLLAAMALILGGIAIGTLTFRSSAVRH